MKKLLVSLLTTILCVTTGFAQNGIIKSIYSKDSIPTFIIFDTENNKINASNSQKTIEKFVNKGSNDEFVLQNALTDEVGYTHYFYQQLYKGIKVENGMYLAHTKNGFLKSINGDFFKIGEVDIVAKLTEKEALSKALDAVGAELYKWQIEKEEEFIKGFNKNINATYYPQGEKVIIYLDNSKKFRLVYKFEIFAHYPLSHENIFIDAITGEVLLKQNLIFETYYEGSADTRYSGTQTITTFNCCTKYHLRELTNSVRIETYNMRLKGSDYEEADDFEDVDNNWTAAEYHSNMDDAALDAHWGVEKTYAYWNTVRQVNSWNDSGAPLLNYVHADLPSINPYEYPDNDNAFWDGQRITYGDGDTVFNPLVSLDVIAHEIGHAFCTGVSTIRHYSYNILSSGNQAFAIGEGMSDIWAAAVEQWAAPTKQNWMVAEEIMKNGYSCLRSLRNPNSEGFRKDYSTEGNYPDTYDSTFYYRGEDARTYSHINSTVLSHWFYLISVGGSDTNDLGNQYNVSSIGITNATAIAWRAELYYFTATTNFSLAREAFIHAASDLFGENSCQVINVTNAWYAVGVGSAFQLSDVTISGTTLVCSSGATFTVNNLPPSCTVSWEKTGNLTLLSSNSNGDTAVFASNSNGPGWIKAFINSASCGTSYPTPYFEVWSGTFESTFVTGQVAVCPDSYYTYTAQVPGGHKPTYSYSWTYPSNWYNYDQYQNTISLVTPMYNPDGGAVRVSITNACGTSGYSGITVYPDYYNCGGYFSLYPNPASEIITITNKISSELETKVEDLNKTYTVRILDIYSNLHFSGIRSGDTFTIPINNLTNGNYIVQISDGKKIYNLKLVIKH